MSSTIQMVWKGRSQHSTPIGLPGRVTGWSLAFFASTEFVLSMTFHRFCWIIRHQRLLEIREGDILRMMEDMP
jgi:hypothetical protein